jgi:hypothetical protein
MMAGFEPMSSIVYLDDTSKHWHLIYCVLDYDSNLLQSEEDLCSEGNMFFCVIYIYHSEQYLNS